jgi:hypothetical protein
MTMAAACCVLGCGPDDGDRGQGPCASSGGWWVRRRWAGLQPGGLDVQTTAGALRTACREAPPCMHVGCWARVPSLRL